MKNLIEQYNPTTVGISPALEEMMIELDSISLECNEEFKTSLEKLTELENSYNAAYQQMVSIEAIVDDISVLLNNGNVRRADALKIKERISALNLTPDTQSQVISIESFGGNSEEYLRVSAESLSNIAWNFWQYVATFWRQAYDVVIDVFRSSTKNAESYLGRFKEQEQNAKNKFNGQTIASKSMDLSGIWIIIGKLKGSKPAMNGVPDFREEVALSTYLNKTYPELAMGVLDKYASIVKSGKYDSIENVEKTVINKLIAIKHPSELFSHQLITDKVEHWTEVQQFPYMGFTALLTANPKVVKKPSPNANIKKLQEMAAMNPIGLVRSKIHRFYNGVRYVPVFPSSNAFVSALNGFVVGASWGNQIISMFSKSELVTSDNVLDMFKQAEQFCNLMIHNNNAMVVKMEQAKHKMEGVANAMHANSNPSKEVKDACKIIHDYGKSIFQCIKYPMVDNIPRQETLLRGMYYYVTYATKRL